MDSEGRFFAICFSALACLIFLVVALESYANFQMLRVCTASGRSWVNQSCVPDKGSN